MNNRSVSLNNSGPGLVREYQRVGSFTVGFLAREHLVTVNALSDYWRQTFLVWWNPVPSVGYMSRADSQHD